MQLMLRSDVHYNIKDGKYWEFRVKNVIFNLF